MGLEEMSVEEIEAYKDTRSAQIDVLRAEMQAAEVVRIQKQAHLDINKMAAAAGIEGAVTITPLPATLGMEPGMIGGDI